MKKFTSLFVLLTTLALASCSSSSSSKPQGEGGDKVVDVTGVTLNASEVSLDVGETYQLTATVAPSDATNKTVHWSSSDEEYVSISERGLLTALKPGNVTVTCVSDFNQNIKATCEVKVNEQGPGEVKVTGVSLNRSTVSLNLNQSVTLVATVSPSDADCKDVLWSSSDSDAASVDNGVVTAKANGTATITVTSVDGGFKDSCVVSINQPVVSVTSVSLNKTSLSLEVGSTSTLVATVLPSNATNKAVSWFSSDSNIVSVNDGLIKAQAAGSATITVKTSDGAKTATCRVTITEPTVNVTSVSLNSSSLALEAGQTSTLVPTVLPENATNKKVTWTSNKTSVATVSTSGLVTAKAKGTATITVKTSDGAKTATCSVTVTEPYVAVSSVSLSKNSLEVGVNRTASLTATVLPSNATDKSVSWNSSNTNVAKVSTSGVVTGVAVGTANITVTTNDGNKTASCAVTVSEVTADKYTVMIYMCGSTLESEYYQGELVGLATEDIKEILSVKNKPDDVNIIIETGGASQWASTYNISNSKLGRYEVIKNSNGSNSLKSVASLTNASMGSSSTFKSFLEWGLDNYPAEKTAVIFWNHGGALDGVCCDENYGDDTLLVSETTSVLSSVLSARGIDKLEWVGYDACLMAVQDIAEKNSQFFNYMVASEESEAGEGWDYDTWVDDLYAGKDTTVILKAICDGFIKSYDDTYGSYDNDQTLSYLNLAYMSDYKDKFEALAAKLTGKGSSIKSLVKSNVKGYAVESRVASYGTYDVVDMLNKMKSNNNFSSYKTEIEACLTTLNNVIGYSKKGAEAGNSNGLCVVVIVSGCYASYDSSETNFTTWRALVK